MTDFDLVFRAQRVITAAGEVARCVGVRDGRIAAIEPYACRTISLCFHFFCHRDSIRHATF